MLIGICPMVTVYVISRRRDYPRQPVAGLVAIAQRGAASSGSTADASHYRGKRSPAVYLPTEAGAVAALYSFIAGKLIYRELSWRDAAQALVRAAQGTATVMVILGASSIFAWIVADLRISHSVAAFIFELSKEPWLVLLVINLFVLLVGLFMDPLAALVILVPVFLPTAVEIGIDPIHFGIIIVINLMIGLCTPPVGYLIYLSATIAETRPETVIRESLPFLAALLIALLLCIFIPPLTLTLPGLLNN
ncbi:MAG: TRAP transporter large permease subunit [Gammaproteobacteria bacterium]